MLSGQNKTGDNVRCPAEPQGYSGHVIIFGDATVMKGKYTMKKDKRAMKRIYLVLTLLSFFSLFRLIP